MGSVDAGLSAGARGVMDRRRDQWTEIGTRLTQAGASCEVLSAKYRGTRGKKKRRPFGRRFNSDASDRYYGSKPSAKMRSVISPVTVNVTGTAS